MKIGVSGYNFDRLIKGGNYTLFDAIKYAASVGYDAIEFIDLKPPEGVSQLEYAAQLRKACGEAGLSVACYAVFADFVYNSGGDAEKEAERVERCVDVAKALGAPCMRHDATWGFKDSGRGRNYMDAIRLVAPAIRRVSEYAVRQGVRTMCENHGYFLQDSERMERLVLEVDHPNFGLLVDMGNFLCADEDNTTALQRVMPYAFHVHAKDFLVKPGMEPKPDESWFPTRAGNHLRGTIVGHGGARMAQCMAYLKKVGYDGTVSLEFEGLEDPLEAVRLGHAFLRAHS